MTKLKKIWASIGISGMLIAVVFGELIYMNLRDADPLLPGWQEYEETAFNRYLDAGEPLLVEVYASYCPTCLLQHKALEILAAEGKQPKIRAIRVDFEEDVAFRARYNIKATGTMMLFMNGKVREIETGLVTSDSILAFLARHGITS